jgi:hypothetical protein
MKELNLEPVIHPVRAHPTADLYSLDLRCHSYEDHRVVVPALLDSLASLGCWVLEQKALSPTVTELLFEVQLRTAFELYGGLLATGIELTRDSHIRMTGLCTLRGHNPRHARRRRIVTVRLELNFLEEVSAIVQGVVVGLA